MKATKLIIFAILSLMIAACNANLPTKAYEGVWEPVIESEYGITDFFVVTSDSIIGTIGGSGSEMWVKYRCAYKPVKKDVVLLDRCWMRDWNPDAIYPEEDIVSETQMYINDEGYLIINEFDPMMRYEQIIPNYTNLKLRKHQK